MGKGILLEMAGRQAVVLTPQGEFKKVPVPKGTWDIGDEIEFAEARRPAWSRWTSVAAAAAVILLAVAPYGVKQYTLLQPVAMVTVDINPSLELTLNKVDEVLQARGLNADGVELLKHVDWKRHPLDQVVQAVTNEAVQEHKLDPADEAGAVLVAVVPAADKDVPDAQADQILNAAKTAANQEVQKVAQAQGVPARTTVAGLKVNSQEKQAAEQQGISPGRLKLYENIKDLVPGLTLEDVVQMGPGKALKKANVNPGDILKQAERQQHQPKPQSQEQNGKDDEQNSLPATTQPGNSQSGGDKNDNPPGKSDEGKGQKDEKGQGGPKKDGKQSDDKQSDQKTDPSGGQSDAKSNKGTPGTEKNHKPEGNPKGNGNPKKGSDKGSSDSWNFFGLTITKPGFMRTTPDENQTDPGQAPADSSPRADVPGAGASDATPNPAAPGQSDSSGNGGQQDSGQDQKNKDKDQGNSDKQDQPDHNDQGHGDGNGNKPKDKHK